GAARRGWGYIKNCCMTLSGAGNGFPAPPECLQKVGGFRCNWEEPGRTNGDVERRVYQQFDQKRARSRGLSKRLLTECNSRRLHFSSEGFAPRTPPHRHSLAGSCLLT